MGINEHLLSFVANNVLASVLGFFLITVCYFHHIDLKNIDALCSAFSDYKKGYPDIERDTIRLSDYSVESTLEEFKREQDIIKSGSLEGKDLAWRKQTEGEIESICNQRQSSEISYINY